MRAKTLPLALTIAMASTAYTVAAEDLTLEQMQTQLAEMQAQIDKLTANEGTAAKSDDFVEIGGAVRFGYQYNDDNSHNGGDMKFDTFRLDVRGQVKGISILSKWRWFQNHKALIQVAEMGYDFTESSNLKGGLTLVPFGNQEYNSHNFDLSPNFYMGLEDVYQLGATYTYDNNGLNIQASFFKNDSSVAGFGEDSYSPTLNTKNSDGSKIGAYNTGALRIVNTFTLDEKTNIEVGASGLYGGVLDNDTRSNVGEYKAFAAHSTMNFDRLNIQLQATHYEYDLEGDVKSLGMAFYGGVYSTIATRATSYTANVKYGFPVNWGPIELLELYNDYTLVTDKPESYADTYDNTIGLGVAAGNVYCFFDWHTQRNFSNMAVSKAASSTSHYFNANFGYYF